MQATTPGTNRTGAAVSPEQINLMIEAVEDLSPPVPIDTAAIDAERLRYIADADSVGSIPPPASLLKGTVKKTVARFNGVSPSLLLNKIGERIAFERAGTRLYDALIAKYLALSNGTAALLPLGEMQAENDVQDAIIARRAGENPLETLRRIRAEEHGHFLMLCDAMAQLGGDPTAQTPSADVTGTASMGLMQVVTDPRTTLAQCLDVMLIAELTDTASWEMLAELAAKAEQRELAEQFLTALDAEEEHLVVVRAWLKELMNEAAGTEAV
ncbi:MAG: ferritin-like domain-containing protein [Pseudomonadota bacterium]|nr:ferritin-like domain-containing protein [Pseudomonadota bacterium]